MSEYDPKRLVFLDESGININLTRHYARAKRGKRAADDVPLNTPRSTTILSSLRLDGRRAYTTFEGGTKREKFMAYLKDVLLPTLHKGDVVIMDNMRTHHIKEVRELLEGAEMEVLYLPAYSPDLNPIEKMWSKVKAGLRKVKSRSCETLSDAVSLALASVSSSDCLGWFRSCFYSC